MMNGYWVHQAPMGYRYQRISGRGAMLKREEPLASVVQEALEGFASGRFESQAEVLRFLQASPVFPKDSRGIVRHQRVGDMLAQPVYAGYLESKVWDISLRPAQHEGLISFETFQRIRDRLSGGVYAPRRKNLNEDFPLRGFVLCDDCNTPLTARYSQPSWVLMQVMSVTQTRSGPSTSNCRSRVLEATTAGLPPYRPGRRL